MPNHIAVDCGKFDTKVNAFLDGAKEVKTIGIVQVRRIHEPLTESEL